MLLVRPALAETLRLATWNAGLDRAGPGLLLHDILSDDDAQVAAVVQVIVALDADVLLLTGVDYDHGLVALQALDARLGNGYPTRFALRPNTGMATGLDIDGDGRLGSPRDAMGWGRFAGEGGMAILSRLPIDEAGVRDLSALLWRDLPGAILPPGFPETHAAVQRLSTTGHWLVPLILPGGGTLTLMVWHATPPVFDGPEDRNGRRNHDEAALWLRLLDGSLGPSRKPLLSSSATAIWTRWMARGGGKRCRRCCRIRRCRTQGQRARMGGSSLRTRAIPASIPRCTTPARGGCGWT